MLRFDLLLVFLFPWLTFSASPTINNSDLLLLGFDGVSYEVIQEMYTGGYFREFQQPIPMVASFPTISDPNWAHIMNTPMEPGYTKAHFWMDHKDKDGIGKEVGNVLKHITYTPHYEKKFDYAAGTAVEHVANVTWTKTAAHYWIHDLEKTMLEQKKPKSPFSAFVINTDFISHVSGRKEMLKYLKFVDGKIKSLSKKYFEKFGRKLDFIIVSDHGNEWVESKGIDLKPLEKSEWYWNTKLTKPTDFAFVAPEIISFGAFYVLPGHEKKFAQDLAKLKGVHVTLALEKENVVNVYSKKGTTQITIDPKAKTVSYKILSGEDPLNQISYFAGSKKSRTWDDYFYNSQASDYPNSLVSAWEGFYKNSQKPASVLASADIGYAFTNMTLEIITKLLGLHSMHGSFHKKQAYGVFMSTRSVPVEYIRPWEVREYLK